MKNCQYIDYKYQDKTQSIIELFPHVKRLSDAPAGAAQHKCDDEYTKLVADILNLHDVERVIFFQMYENYGSRIHIDGNLKRNLVRTFALNLPLTQCNHAEMRWYKQKPNTETKLLDDWLDTVEIPLLDRDNAELIETNSCNKPMIVKVNDWHDIRNTQCSNGLEYYISIRFNSHITIDDVIEMVK
jgi:hypothetical protein